MKITGSVHSFAATAALAVAALGSSVAVQARGDVVWSVGVGSPGVHFGVSNAPPPVVVYRRPVLVIPQPVYIPQRPIIVQPMPIYYGQPQVVYAPQPYYAGPGWERPGRRQGWGPRHFGKHRWDRYDGYRGRDDDDDDDRGHRGRRGHR